MVLQRLPRLISLILSKNKKTDKTYSYRGNGYLLGRTFDVAANHSTSVTPSAYLSEFDAITPVQVLRGEKVCRKLRE